MYVPRIAGFFVAAFVAVPATAQPTLPRDRVPAVPQSLRGFVDRLYSVNPADRADAACEIGRRHRDAAAAVPILLTMLHDDVVVPSIECKMRDWNRWNVPATPEARKWLETSPAKEAADAMGEIGDAAVPGLIQQLTNNDWRVRKFAAYGLGEAEPQMERVQAVIALGERLADANAEVRDQCAWALGEIEDAAAVPALAGALRQDSDPRVRRRAAWAMGEIEHSSAVEALVSVMTDPDLELRKQVVWALGEIESGLAVDGLVRALADTEVSIRKQAAWALGEIEDADAVPGLVAALAGDADVSVRSQAAWALGEIESRAAVDGLIQALKDSDYRVRKQAAWALGEIEDPTALEPLRAARYDVNVEVREAVARSIRGLRDR
jgi:HEAT repeat protein